MRNGVRAPQEAHLTTSSKLGAFGDKLLYAISSVTVRSVAIEGYKELLNNLYQLDTHFSNLGTYRYGSYGHHKLCTSFALYPRGPESECESPTAHM